MHMHCVDIVLSESCWFPSTHTYMSFVLFFCRHSLLQHAVRVRVSRDSAPSLRRRRYVRAILEKLLCRRHDSIPLFSIVSRYRYWFLVDGSTDKRIDSDFMINYQEIGIDITSGIILLSIDIIMHRILLEFYRISILYRLMID